MAEYLCQNIDLNSIIKCSFSLSDAELKVFKEIVFSDNAINVNELADKIDRDRSTVQKIILRLCEKNLVEKKKQILEEGGIIYYYIPKSKSSLKKEMLINVNVWHDSVRKEINKW